MDRCPDLILDPAHAGQAYSRFSYSATHEFVFD